MQSKGNLSDRFLSPPPSSFLGHAKNSPAWKVTQMMSCWLHCRSQGLQPGSSALATQPLQVLGLPEPAAGIGVVLGRCPGQTAGGKEVVGAVEVIGTEFSSLLLSTGRDRNFPQEWGEEPRSPLVLAQPEALADTWGNGRQEGGRSRGHPHREHPAAATI